jgi:tetratricopeptide (TPR) repeat protein
VAFDRDLTLKQGEKFLRQGRLDAAIGEYTRVLDEQPHDWNTANLVGDLHFRAGRVAQAVSRYRDLAGQLLAGGFYPKAGGVYRKLLKLRPHDEGTQLALAEIDLRSGRSGDACALIVELAADDPGRRHSLLEIALALCEAQPDAAYACVETIADLAVAACHFDEAASHLGAFLRRRPLHVPALLKLVEVCVDGGSAADLNHAQVQLCDGYLAAGQAAEARVIAEDLVAAEPWIRVHIERLRDALVRLEVDDPDAHVADLLSGNAPFMTSEWLTDLSTGDLEPDPRDQAPDRDAVSEPEGTNGFPHPLLVLPGPAGCHEDLDLAGAVGNPGLTAMPGAESTVDLEDLLRTMRTEAELDPAIGDGDFASQYVALASGYIETGLLEDAILSLETAAGAPAHRFEAAAMLGRLYLTHGEPLKAIEWLQQAAQETATTPEHGRAVLFDLAVLLDESGEADRALALFLELQAAAGDYHDVPSRIDRLARVKGGG